MTRELEALAERVRHLEALERSRIVDGDWIGLGAGKGRIEFNDAATDTIVFRDCEVDIGCDHVRATSDSGQSIPNAAWTILICEDEVHDTNSEYVAATGIFTAKRSGYLSISSFVLFTSTTNWSASEVAVMSVYVGVNHLCRLDWKQNITATNQSVALSGNTVLPISLGDTVTIRLYQSSGAALALSGNTSDVWLTFDWLA